MLIVKKWCLVFQTENIQSNNKSWHCIHWLFYLVHKYYIDLISFLVPGCNNVALVGNGFCNDVTNNADCNYDGGDCCVLDANTNSCSECVCHFLETCAAGYHPLVGNGFCDDETNIVECDHDGGDCCSNPELVGDGICNDVTNNLECNSDGGDCCGPAVSCK